MSKHVETKINELKSAVAKATVALSQYLKEEESISFSWFDDYCATYRFQINCIIIEALLGCKIKKNKKGDAVIKFNAPLPTMAEFSEISLTLDKFINEEEIKYLEYAAEKEDDEDEDDLSIEDDVKEITTLNLDMDKINNKNVRNSIPSMAHVLLSPVALPEIAALGVELRKHNVKKTALIIGGIVLTVAAGTAGAIAVKKHCDSKDNSELIEASDVTDDSVDDADIDTEIDSDDAPVVELDA